MPNYEVIYFIAKPRFRLSPGAYKAGAVWDIPQDKALRRHEIKMPPTFPLELAMRCIRAGPDNGPVMDPYLGTGTTAIAAKRLGRDWIGIEQSDLYCQLAEERISSSAGESH